jgi:hypothetical protein
MSAQLQPSGQPLTLVRKLAQIMSEIDRIPKRGFNAYHGYHYVQESDLVDTLRAKLADKGIFLFQSVVNERRENTLTTLTIQYTFVDSESGESWEVSWVGQGDDKGDKGAYKATTGALKYLLLKHFMIPTGDDPEADASTDERTYAQQPKKPFSRRPPHGKTGESAAQVFVDKTPGHTTGAATNNAASAKEAEPSKLAQVADAEDVKRVFRHGRALNLSVDELGNLLAKIRGGNRSTEAITVPELELWKHSMDELSEKRMAES